MNDEVSVAEYKSKIAKLKRKIGQLTMKVGLTSRKNAPRLARWSNDDSISTS